MYKTLYAKIKAACGNCSDADVLEPKCAGLLSQMNTDIGQIVCSCRRHGWFSCVLLFRPPFFSSPVVDTHGVPYCPILPFTLRPPLVRVLSAHTDRVLSQVTPGP